MEKLNKLALFFLKLKNETKFKKGIIKKYNPKSELSIENIVGYNNSRDYGFQQYLCNAPFVSMYFGLMGEVSVCCLNRTYLIGNIKQESIRDIWNGERIKALRMSIANQTLNLGCGHCLHQIKAGNYNNLVANEYDGYSVSKTEYPKVITFELDNTCNLACVFCSGTFSSTFNKHFEKNELEEKSIYDEKFIEQIRPFLKYLKKANFLGGEPFLINIYLDIIDELLLVNPSCEIHIQTNGQVFNNRVKKILNKANVRIGISLETVDKDKFAQIRTFGSLDKLVGNIHNIKQNLNNKKASINLSITPIRSTINEMIPIMEFANQHQLTLFFNVLYSPYRYALWSMDSRELEKIIKTIEIDNYIPNNLLQEQNLNRVKSFLNLTNQWISESKDRTLKYDSKASIDELLIEANKRINRYLKQINIFNEEEKEKLQIKLNKIIQIKLDRDFESYHRIIYNLLTMPDDVIFGCVSHYSF